MICYRDRTYCQTPSCGKADCSRIVTDEIRDHAARLNLPIYYAIPCVSPAPTRTAPDQQQPDTAGES